MVDTNKILGQVINDRYRVLELIGKGGSGHVYKAVNVENNELVALKILKISADSPESVIRFEKEVAVSARLTNPHSIKLFEFGRTVEGYLLIAMEFLDGTPLSTLIEKEAPLSPKRAASIVIQTLEALAEAHRLGIVHRDLKPDNIFILDQGGDDFVKVLDFGIAKFLHEDTVGDTLSRDGFIFGTPLYISPEQALGWQVSPASDVYSLGVVFFEMLAGFPPFSAETPIGLGMKHIYEPPPIDRLKVDGTSYGGIRHLLTMMLEKRPERRPANAGTALALFAALEEITETPFPVIASRVQPQVGGTFGHPTVKARPVPEDEILASPASEQSSAAQTEAQPEPIASAPESTESLGAAVTPRGVQMSESQEESGGKKKRKRKKKKKGGSGGEQTAQGSAWEMKPADLLGADVSAEFTGELTEESAEYTGELDGDGGAEEAGAAPSKPSSSPAPSSAAATPAPAAGLEAAPTPRASAPFGSPGYERRKSEGGQPVLPKITPADTSGRIDIKSAMADFALPGAPPSPAPSAEDDYDAEDSDPGTVSHSAPSGVGVFAWIVLVFGLALVAFVLYALFVKTPRSPQTDGVLAPPAVHLSVQTLIDS